MSHDPVILAADIGGTNARFMLARPAGMKLDVIVQGKLRVAAHATFEDACAAFLSGQPAMAIEGACVAVAGPIDGRTAQLTNSPWRIDADVIGARFAIDRVRLINDFAAAAAGIDDLSPSALKVLQHAPGDVAGARLVIGAGTGLGVAYVLADQGAPRVVAGEGGHVGFAPADDEQIELLRWLLPSLRRVSAEQVVSGMGLARLYAFASRGVAEVPDDVAKEGAVAVSRRFAQGDPVAQHALRLFASILGSVAGDHALSILATGGVYVAGGIAPRFAGHLAQSGFIAAFRAKGRHAALMERMPIALVSEDGLGLLGAARCALGLAGD